MLYAGIYGSGELTNSTKTTDNIQYSFNLI